jgi:hypothetical protein
MHGPNSVQDTQSYEPGYLKEVIALVHCVLLLALIQKFGYPADKLLY